MLFKTNDALLAQVRECVKQRGICYLHGDGNFYTKEQASNFRAEFGNPGQVESKYRIVLKTGDTIGNVESMNKALLDAYHKEEVQKSIPAAAQVADILVMPKADAKPAPVVAAKQAADDSTADVKTDSTAKADAKK